MLQESEEPKNFPNRPDKTIDWLNKSRNVWKNKTQFTKGELKVAKQAQKRARKSRQKWKEECQLLERQQSTILAEKGKEISNLKTKIEELEQENADLKKKYLLRLMTQK